MDNICIYCGTILKGRIDKRFCDNQCWNDGIMRKCHNIM